LERDKSIQRVLGKYPSASLLLGSTAIQHLTRLSSRLGHNIYVKRDDLISFGLVYMEQMAAKVPQ
jgi:1-aminocyclopropane-1-carboxylate deaminase/D-cysteine desulfhydrase-like pyridoxal-dependent ACC family enzyme